MIVLSPTIRSRHADSLQAIDLLNQAVARDPSFFEAYCRSLSLMTSFTSLARPYSCAVGVMAEAAIEEAFRIRPDAGEAHLARARASLSMDTSIMTALWLNWKLPARRCPMIRGYSD